VTNHTVNNLIFFACDQGNG